MGVYLSVIALLSAVLTYQLTVGERRRRHAYFWAELTAGMRVFAWQIREINKAFQDLGVSAKDAAESLNRYAKAYGIKSSDITRRNA